jgi:proteasome lid subunit RPN8/RPN11
VVVRIPASELVAMAAHGARAFPEEACGFLLGPASSDQGDTRVAEAQPAQNQKQDERTRRYLIEPQQLMEADAAAAARGLDIVGFYHSHPTGDAWPSAFDRAHAWPRYAYVIVAVTAGQPGEVRAWRLAPDRATFVPEAMVQIA